VLPDRPCVPRLRLGLMLHELIQYRSLVLNLVLKDLRLKYRESTLGVLWSLLHPLLLLSTYVLAFKIIMRVPIESYPSFLLAGLLPWTFFAGALQASTQSIIGNGHLIKRVRFPREVLPVSTVLFAFVQLLLALTVFWPASLILTRLPPTPSVLCLPLILVLHLCFTSGLALALSALTARFQDVIHLTEVGLLLLFWLTPVVYPLSMAPGALQQLLLLSPPAAFTVAYQEILVWGRLPSLRVLAVLAVATLASLLLGRLMFARRQVHFAEEI
jgi:lipopolysaccharide transport system permease protein